MSAPPVPPAPSPLVGRDRELATLAGRGALVLVGGEAGIGKTTLAEVLLAAHRMRGELAIAARACAEATGHLDDALAELHLAEGQQAAALENIYRKIAARNRADATAFALRHRLA